jgi:biofilm PGA synthesis N-glycosyltransferase PgaC
MDLLTILDLVEHSAIYLVALVFFAWYPIFSSLMWILTSLIYFFRRERRQGEDFYRLDTYASVTVLIPAYNEERNIENTLRAATSIDYPEYEVVVVDDASTDRTADIVTH